MSFPLPIMCYGARIRSEIVACPITSLPFNFIRGRVPRPSGVPTPCHRCCRWWLHWGISFHNRDNGRHIPPGTWPWVLGSWTYRIRYVDRNWCRIRIVCIFAYWLPGTILRSWDHVKLHILFIRHPGSSLIFLFSLSKRSLCQYDQFYRRGTLSDVQNTVFNIYKLDYTSN